MVFIAWLTKVQQSDWTGIMVKNSIDYDVELNRPCCKDNRHRGLLSFRHLGTI